MAKYKPLPDWDDDYDVPVPDDDDDNANQTGGFVPLSSTPVYARPNVTKYQVYQFFMSTKNLHIKSFTLISSCLIFMSG